MNTIKNIVGVEKVVVNNIEMGNLTKSFYGNSYEYKVMNIYLRPYERLQCLCPKCMKKMPIYDHAQDSYSHWRAANLNGIPVYLNYRPARIECPEHGVLTEYIPWSDGNGRFTETFNNEIAFMATKLSKQLISYYYLINWRTVGNCIQSACDRLEPDKSRRLEGIKRICVDETSIAKGYKYITVVYDMDTNRVVWVSQGHGREIFSKFCLTLNEEQRNNIEIVAGDGAKWIDSCTTDYFPNAVRCIDPFHSVSWAVEALDNVRKESVRKARVEYNKACQTYKEQQELAQKTIVEEKNKEAINTMSKDDTEKKEEYIANVESLASGDDYKSLFTVKKDEMTDEQKSVILELEEKSDILKSSRYAISKNPENLTENQQAKLELIKCSCKEVYTAYEYKEAFRIIIHMKDVKAARIELDAWIERALASGIKQIVKLAQKIIRNKEGILMSIQYHANSAKSESCNSLIKQLIFLAKGFRNFNNLKSLIFLKCNDEEVPLRNRPHLSGEEMQQIRAIRNMKRRMREEAKREAISA